MAAFKGNRAQSDLSKNVRAKTLQEVSAFQTKHSNTQIVEETILETSPHELREIAHKVISKKRISVDDGLLLFTTPHHAFVQQLADFDRWRRVGDIVLYASTLHIYPTNLCTLSCPMCSFSAKPGQKKAWFYTPTMIEDKVKAAIHLGITEVHIVGGLWEECSLNYYEEVFRRIKTVAPSLHIKALTAVEYDFLAHLHNLSVCDVLQKMMLWGVSSLPGGGAEILNDAIRQHLCPGKISSDRFLEIHKIAHTLGLPSNITMLFGHIEDECHILNHLDKIRQLQDMTKGFHTFVPLRYHQKNNSLGKMASRIKPKDCRQIYAISRLMLDNVDHIKVPWNFIGLDQGKELLHWGGNDLGSVTHGEQVAVMAGGTTVIINDCILEDIIRSEGRIPMKVHSGCRMRHSYEEAQS